MSRTPEYEKLLAELKAELPITLYKILKALLQAPKGLNRKGRIRVVFGEEPQTNLGNDTRDRKIRKGSRVCETGASRSFPLRADPATNWIRIRRTLKA